MRLIVDENVPTELATFFRDAGHDVSRITDFFDPGLPDVDIARFGNELEAVVVTFDRDFKRLIQRVPYGNRARFRRLGRISFDCKMANARRRAEVLLDYIEFAYEMAQRSRDRRLIIEITETSFRVIR